MRVARIDIWMRQQILDHRRVSLADSDMKSANTLEVKRRIEASLVAYNINSVIRTSKGKRM